MCIPDSTNTKPYFAETNLRYARISRISVLNPNFLAFIVFEIIALRWTDG